MGQSSGGFHSMGETRDNYDWEVAESLEDGVQKIRMEKCAAVSFYGLSNLNDQHVGAIARCISENFNLQALDLWDNNMGNASAHVLAKAIRKNTRLAYLSFGSNNVHENGAKMFIEGLKYNKTLMYLNFSRVDMGDDGAILLSQNLKENPTLATLNISSNSIGIKGACAIANSLKTNTALIRLDMCYNDIGDIGCQSLAESLKTNNTLYVLLVGGVTVTNIGNIGARSFVSALEVNSNLVALAITGQEINPEIEEEIMHHLKVNTAAHKKTRNVFNKVLAEGGFAPWSRSKLTVVGQGRQGKTGTVRSLLGQKFLPDTDSTVAMAISSHQAELTGKEWIPKNESVDMTTTLAAEVASARSTYTIARKKDKLRKLRNKYTSKRRLYWKRKQSSNENTEHTINSAPSPVKEDRVYKTESFDDDTKIRPPLMSEEDIAKTFHTRLGNKARDRKGRIDLTIFDYGGQSVFYTLHHLFLTKYGVYLVVFDMQEMLNDEVTSSDHILCWLNSIQLHSPEASILIVGTFLDKLSKCTFFASQREKLIRISNAIDAITQRKYNTVSNKELSFFPLSNVTGKGVQELREKIEEVVRAQDYVSNLVSLRWVRCLDLLSEGKFSGKDWYSFAEVKEVAKTVGIQSQEEVNEMCSLFHDFGLIIRLTATEALKDVVTVNPQWLIDSIGKIIRDDNQHGFNTEDIKKVGLMDDLNLFKDRALLSRDLIELLWFNQQVDFLLDFMKQTMLICEWDFGRGEPMYLIPSLLKTKEGHRMASNDGDNICEFDFSEKCLPNGVFQLLMCLCVAHSNRVENSPEPEFHDYFCKIWIGPDCHIRLYQRSDTIELVSEPVSKAHTCLAMVLSMLKKINGDIMNNELVWNVKLRYGDEEVISYDDAKSVKRYPWFLQEDGANVKTDHIDLKSFLDNMLEKLL